MRTLGRLAVVRAWFELIKDCSPPRYAFRMDVAFEDDRLGGGDNEPVRFRVGLKRCEIVVILPRGETKLKVDQRTVRSGQSPANVTIERKTGAVSELKGKGELGVGPSGATGSANMAASAERTRSVTATTNDVVPVLLGTRSRTKENDQSWRVSRTDGAEILQGMLWNANEDGAMFELIDGRAEEVRDREYQTGLHATATVEVRCKREDLEVTDIMLTDPEEKKLMRSLINRNKAMKVAEAFIKQQLRDEGLRVGNIHEGFSDLVVSDLLVALVEENDTF